MSMKDQPATPEDDADGSMPKELITLFSELDNRARAYAFRQASDLLRAIKGESGLPGVAEARRQMRGTTPRQE